VPPFPFHSVSGSGKLRSRLSLEEHLLSSRRRRSQTRKIGPDSNSPATVSRISPLAPSNTEGGTSKHTASESRISKPPAVDVNLHFKTGKKGKLARFFAKIRAARDPFDETVVIPCLIFLWFLRLYELGRINAWAFGAGLIIPASLAGLWIGSCLGDRGIFRAALRGVIVGAIEGAGFAAIAKETLTQSGALQSGLNLIYMNVVFFWFFSAIGALASNIATLSEEDWQRWFARRAFPSRRLIPLHPGTQNVVVMWVSSW